MLSNDEIRNLYSINYFKRDYRCKAQNPYWQSIVYIQKDFRRRILPLVQRYIDNEGHRALEIGCAGGASLKVLSEAGFEAIGVELNPKIAKMGKKHLNVNIMVGTLEEQTFSENSFNIVYMGDVLEHIPEPINFLREVWRVTSENAILVIDIPFEMNAILPRSFFALIAPLIYILWRYEKRSSYPPYHVFVYNPKTIKALLVKAGFRIIYLRSAKILRLPSWKTIFDLPNFLLTKIFNVLGDRATIIARKDSS